MSLDQLAFWGVVFYCTLPPSRWLRVFCDDLSAAIMNISNDVRFFWRV